MRDVSTNGTWVDGQRVRTVDIRGQMSLRLGTPTGPEVVVNAGPEPGARGLAPTGMSTMRTDTAYPVGAPPGAPAGRPPLGPPPPAAPPPAPPLVPLDGGERPDGTAPLRPPGSRGRRHRRWPWITLVVVLLVAVAVDRIAVVVATRQVVRQVQTSEKLTTKPGATIGGFPFLTQVAAGKYSDVSITIHNLTTPGPRIDLIVAHLKGVHVPLGAALSGKVKRVPVDKISASVFIAFNDLNGYLKGLPGDLQLGSNGSGVQLSGQIPGLSSTLGALMTASFAVGSGGLTLSPTALGGTALPLPQSILNQLTANIPLGSLPFNLQLVSVKIQPDGVAIAATATHVVLPAS
jgi:LmeA-like phospholipid-binding